MLLGLICALAYQHKREQAVAEPVGALGHIPINRIPKQLEF